MDLELLLAHADDRQPVLRQGLTEKALQETAGMGELPDRLWDLSGDSNLLPRQRWGVVAPEGPTGERLLALVEPLRRLREAAQEGAPARIYRVPPGMDAPLAARWKKRVFRDERVDEAERPRYLLLLGDLDQVSLELQQALSTDAFVGRLAFPTDAGYEAYVAKVLRWEGSPVRGTRPRLLFYTARDGSGATEAGHQGLIAPSVAACQEHLLKGRFPPVELVDLSGGDEAATGQLLSRAAEPGPGVLFSVSHGLGAPRNGWESAARQRELQGALVLPGGHLLTGAELAARPFLPGGIWFCFACFGAGTPASSAYAHWLRQLPGVDPNASREVTAAMALEAQRPFIAALPQAVLANPDGPLAVMGHVDLAWSYSFRDQGRGTPSRFLGVLQALAGGSRAGVALGALLRFVNETSLELTSLYNQEELSRLAGSPSPVDPVARAYLWLLRQDLSGYLLLGDPAVRLPLAGPGMRASAPGTSLEALASVGLGGFDPPTLGDSTRTPADAEEAVLALLTGQFSPEELAARHGLPAEELLRWKELYRSAGLAALTRHLSGRG